MKTDITVNHEQGRKGHAVRAIVLHRTEGSFMSGMSWTHDPKSQVSYHFIIDNDGMIYNTVDIKDTAWANGRVNKPTWKGIDPKTNPNYETISVALSGLAKDKPTEAQVLSFGKLLGELSVQVDLPLNEKTLVFHREIASDKTCPGIVPSKEILILFAEAYKRYNRF